MEVLAFGVVVRLHILPLMVGTLGPSPPKLERSTEGGDLRGSVLFAEKEFSIILCVRFAISTVHGRSVFRTWYHPGRKEFVVSTPAGDLLGCGVDFAVIETHLSFV